MAGDVPESHPGVEVLHRGKFLRVLRDGRWEFVARNSASGAGFIIAVTPARQLLLVEQYRVPLHARTIELPAGIIGDSAEFSDETVEASALRELLEETGWQGRHAHRLCSGPTAPGLTSEMGHYTLIEDLTQVHAGGGIDGEDIVVHSPPLAEIDLWLDGKRSAGLVIDPRIYTGLYLLSKQGPAPG